MFIHMPRIAIKSLILSGLLAVNAMADSPLIAVQDFMERAKKGEADDAKFETRGMTEKEVIAMLKKVDPEKAIFVGMSENGEQIHWMKDPKDPNLYNVRMANPMCIGFKVRFVPGEKENDKGSYQVVAVQP